MIVDKAGSFGYVLLGELPPTCGSPLSKKGIIPPFKLSYLAIRGLSQQRLAAILQGFLHGGNYGDLHRR